MTRVLIWGGGGHGKVVSDVARAAGLEIIGFIDADIRKLNSIVEPGGARVVLTQQDFLRQIREAELPLGAQAVVLAVGDNVARCNCRKNLSARLLASVVHPSAVICNSAQIEAGAVIMPGAIVNAAAIVGPGAVINTGAIVSQRLGEKCRIHVPGGAFAVNEYGICADVANRVDACRKREAGHKDIIATLNTSEH